MLAPTSEVKYDDTSSIPESYLPIIYKLPEIKDKKIYDAATEISRNIDYPLLSLGFQQYLHANVGKMNIIKEFEGKKKVYTTMNLFEPTIDNYDITIENVTTEYFKFKGDEKALGYGFYSAWEIFAMFNIIPTDTETFSSVFLQEKDCSCAQAAILFRDTFAKKTKDSYYINPIGKLSPNGEIFIKSQGKKITVIKSDDITEPKTIKSIIADVKKVDFVSACKDYDWEYKITLEQDNIVSTISEIFCALNILDNGGNFLCKMYETFTLTSCKLIYMLTSCFDEVYIVKPRMSHASSPERFIVCKNYKAKPKLIEQFEKIIKIASENTKLNVVNIFPDLTIPTDFHTTLMCANTEIANKQIICINRIVSFIKDQNYFGDVYSEWRGYQINACTYWTNQNYPNKGDFNKMKKLLSEIKEIVISKNNKTIDKFMKI